MTIRTNIQKDPSFKHSLSTYVPNIKKTVISFNMLLFLASCAGSNTANAINKPTALELSPLASTTPAASQEDIPTLKNYYNDKISTKIFYAAKQEKSVEQEKCSYKILPQEKLSVDSSFLRETTDRDIEYFQNKRPFTIISFAKKIKTTQKTSEMHTLHERFTKGPSSDDYKNALDSEHALIAQYKLPFAPGKYTVTHSEDYIPEITKWAYDLYKADGINLSYSGGTGNLITYKGRKLLLSAGHISDDIPHRKDILLTSLFEQKGEHQNDLFVHELDTSIDVKDLLNKPLQLYFYRSGCSNEKPKNGYMTFDITPTIVSEEDVLFANGPADLLNFMGGVSGAGVYYEGKLVGIFTGGPSESINGVIKSPAMRIVSMSAIKKILEKYDKELSSKEDVYIIE